MMGALAWPVLAVSWVNPSLLGFLSLTAIPIIIYLINRQRFQRVPWAAMEFLLAAMRKNRRRLQLENLLLLLLRILIIALFVLGMARPVFESGVPVLDTSTRSELLVLDRSFSMGFLEGSRSILFQARESAKAFVKSLSNRDRMGLILAGGFPEVVVNDAQFLTQAKVEELIEQLEAVELTYEPLDVVLTLQSAAQWIETQRQRGAEGTWQVRLYTDMQEKDWLAPGDPGLGRVADPAIVDALNRLGQAEAHLVVYPMGSPRARNVSVVSVDCTSPLLTVDLPTSFQVSLVNRCGDPMAGLEVEFSVNGEVQGSTQVALEPDGQKQVTFPYVFREPGAARVSARLRSDGLDEDNVSYAVFEVRESVNVRIADGTAGSLVDDTEGSWLRAALTMPTSAGNLRLTPYDVQVVPAKDLALTSLSGVDVLVLADVPTLSAHESDAIQEFLQRGGGVLTFLGSLVDPTSYVENAYRDGQGWFPYAPEQQLFDATRQTYFKWRILQKEHPVLRYLASEPRAGLEELPVQGWVPTSTVLPEGAVLMELSDARKSPALVEKFVGSGTVLTLHVGAGRTFSEFPVWPAYLVFLHEALPYLTSRGEERRNLRVKEPFSARIAAERFSSRVLLINPDGSGHPVNLRPVVGDSGEFALEVDPRERPGIYEVRFGEAGAEASRSEWFAVNGDPAEGDLRRVATEELKDTYPGAPLYFVDEARAAAGDEPTAPEGTGEAWRSLFWLVVALLVAESTLARFFGRGKV
ncbi:MAG: BatA domain-containing protein [Planctomycetota bacterium]